MMTPILLVEDDIEITQLLTQYLPKYGFEVISVSAPSRALEKLSSEDFSLLLLDLSLPEMDGLELCKRIKKEYPDLPIIISTARGDVSDRVIGLESGASDYLPKPYDPRELVARIQNILRLHQRLAPTHESEFLVDPAKMQIAQNGNVLSLTMAEYEIFALLLKKRQQVISREFIANSINALRWDSSDRSIDVIVGRIRHKIDDDSKSPRYIKSIRGVGYKYIGS